MIPHQESPPHRYKVLLSTVKAQLDMHMPPVNMCAFNDEFIRRLARKISTIISSDFDQSNELCVSDDGTFGFLPNCSEQCKNSGSSANYAYNWLAHAFMDADKGEMESFTEKSCQSL